MVSIRVIRLLVKIGTEDCQGPSPRVNQVCFSFGGFYVKPTQLCSSAVAALLVGAVFLAACGGPGIGLDAVTMPDADLAVVIHPQAMRQAAFWDGVAELTERQAAGIGDSTIEQFAFFRQVLVQTELTADDLLEIRVAARMRDDRIRPVTGFLLARPLTSDATVTVLKSLAEQYDRPVTITELDHPAGTLLQIEMQASPNAEKLLIGFAPGETVIFQGVEEEVLAAMDRLESGQAAPLSGELARVSATVGLEVQAWLAYTVSENQRGAIIDLFGVDDTPAPLKGLADSLDGFTSAVAEFEAGDSMEVRLHWYFEGDGKAESFHTSMTGLTELLKGLVALASGGRPIDAVNSMTLTRADQVVRLDLAVSQSDLLTLEELYELNLTE